MRPRVKLTNATLISIKSELEERVDQVLYATFSDDSDSSIKGETLFTSKVMEINGLEYRTFGANFYLLDAKPHEFNVSVAEFNLMYDCMHSPEEVLELR